ncbi:MAG: hypothetical protein HC850_13105 [Rhodomicrobium sp.]|nr:hypothetical protein [Rhodomicrobium sp.]
MNAFEKFHHSGEVQAHKPLKLSGLVKRLIGAQEDAAKSAIHWHLSQQSDQRLRESLGFTDDDIRALRAGHLRMPWSHGSSR